MSESLEPTAGQPDGSESQAPKVVAGIIIILGLFSNSLIVAAVIGFRRMKTTTNYLLVNVAAADITTLLFTAMHLIPIKGPFPNGALGSFLCKFIRTNNITMVTLLVSTLTLTVLAADRYQAMVKPLKISWRLKIEKIGYVLAVIWLIAMATVSPLFVSVDQRPSINNTLCSPGDDHAAMKVYIYCLVTLLTLIPFLGIAFCYSRIISGLYFGQTICSRGSEAMAEKKRLVIVLMVLTVVFFIAFVPYGVAVVLQFSGMATRNVEELRIFSRFRIVVQYLTLLNCSLNPFIYAIPSSNYRYCFKCMLKKMCCQDITEEVNAIQLDTRRGVANER